MLKKILIVDDQALNRKILCKLLRDQYDVLEAENGRDALALLNQQGASVSAILLDLIMPEMSGYEFLDAVSRDAKMSSIPVIVASQSDKSDAEEKALRLGARDFVSKPYNAVVLRKRLANLIELYETNSTLLRFERDELTGLYNKDGFGRQAAKMLLREPDKDYTLVATDIERFKLVNDSFGMDAGDALLRYIAEQLSLYVQMKNGTCARLNADHFVALLPERFDADGFRSVIDVAEKILRGFAIGMKISLKFGVYPIKDKSIPIELMCDRAMLAADSVKGQYHCVYSFYDDSIRQRLLREQEITDSMTDALAQGQFHVYLQPKYEIRSEQVAGAEALVRWLHPTLGLISPGEFIPMFEKNGFISELDPYIWDKACEIMAGWKAANEKCVSVSVNVSRKDIYQLDLPEILTKTVEKHGLSPGQLHLEITETAYTDNPEQLIAVIARLKALGFVIEMDDFGNGYSSLNMLSELPIDILKLDMRFIQRESGKNSNRNILSFITSLAKWMNLLVIAEGVETLEQVELLRNMDCNYVQGYYYAKPMPVADFTRLLRGSPLCALVTMENKRRRSRGLIIGEEADDRVMLIADASQPDREVLAEYFRDVYNIVEVGDGQAAYKYIEEHSEDIAVIMLDLDMPLMDGISLLKMLRYTPRFASIPVIVVSRAGGCSEARAFEYGANDFLSKPYDLDIALHRVQNVTSRSTVPSLERENRMLAKMKKLTDEVKLDPMTGIYNRIEMERQVQEFFASDNNGGAVFFMLDIDNFKTVNDRYGHMRGDEVILRVAGTLRELFREEDSICRMGGDEFSVFMRTALTDRQLRDRLELMSSGLGFKVEDVDVSCSIGVCVAPEFGSSYQEVYNNADQALLTAKRLGKSRWHIYSGEAGLPEQPLPIN